MPSAARREWVRADVTPIRSISDFQFGVNEDLTGFVETCQVWLFALTSKAWYTIVAFSNQPSVVRLGLKAYVKTKWVWLK